MEISMKIRLTILSLLVIVVAIGLSRLTEVVAMNTNEQETYTGAPGVELTPGPHFAYQQQMFAQASGVARLDLPKPLNRLPAGQAMNLGEGVSVTMSPPLANKRQNTEILRDVLVEAKKANPNLSARDIKALVQDGDIVKIIVECNCSPKALLVSRVAPDTPVRYFTFKVDRKYLGVEVAAGPETDEIRAAIQNSARIQ
jgi:hypothetical protein